MVAETAEPQLAEPVEGNDADDDADGEESTDQDTQERFETQLRKMQIKFLSYRKKRLNILERMRRNRAVKNNPSLVSDSFPPEGSMATVSLSDIDPEPLTNQPNQLDEDSGELELGESLSQGFSIRQSDGDDDGDDDEDDVD